MEEAHPFDRNSFRSFVFLPAPLFQKILQQYVAQRTRTIAEFFCFDIHLLQHGKQQVAKSRICVHRPGANSIVRLAVGDIVLTELRQVAIQMLPMS